MSKIEVNQISSQCGSTLTIGQSGDTVTLACGASQTGFGRTGTVNWDTTAKTAGFTAVSGNGYFVNTTSGAITVTLPATPSAGDIVALQDYAGTWETNNVTVARNGSNIGGIAEDVPLSTSNQSITLVYVDATRGWQTVNDSTQNIDGAQYVTATGGTVTCCGDYKIHTFTSPGTFTVTNAGNPFGSDTVDYLVVAGGGGGACCSGGGGGAGGFRASSETYTVGCAPAAPLINCVSALPVSATTYPVTVGGGGATGTSQTAVATPGSNSIFSTITSAGGGGGKGRGASCGADSGGSGGGGANETTGPGVGGTGNTPPVSPPQGNPGGDNSVAPAPLLNYGGGGGAIAAGGDGDGPLNKGGDGGAGAGVPNAFGTSGENCGSYYYFSGGGGGGKNGPSSPTGVGGIGGGGNGQLNVCAGNPPSCGTANTGGGGGGGGAVGVNGGGGDGGSGIVIIRYKYQ